MITVHEKRKERKEGALAFVCSTCQVEKLDVVWEKFSHFVMNQMRFVAEYFAEELFINTSHFPAIIKTTNI